MDLFRSCLGLDLAWHRDRRSGELVERVDSDTKALLQFLDIVTRLAGAALLPAGILASIALEDLRAASAIGLFAAISTVGLSTLARRAIPEWKTHCEKSAETFGFIGEALAAREDLKGLGAGAWAVDALRGRFCSRSRSARSSGKREPRAWERSTSSTPT